MKKRTRSGADQVLAGRGRRLFTGVAVACALLTLHLILSPMVFSGDTVDADEYPKVVLTTLAALTLAALGISEWLGSVEEPFRRLGAALRGQFRGRRVAEKGAVPRSETLRDPVAWGGVLFLISATASTVWSISPRLSFYGAPNTESGLVSMLAYVVLFWATRRWCQTDGDVCRLLTAVVISASTASAYAVVQFAHADPIAWERVSTLGVYARPFGTMGHPNFLAGYLVMALPVILFLADRAARGRNWLGLATFVLAGGLSGLAILATVSRGAWVALAVVLPFCALCRLINGKNWRFAGLSIMVLLLAVAAVLVVGRFTPEGQELLSVASTHLHDRTNADRRIQMWAVALSLFRARPWLGQGLDVFCLAFPRERTVAYALAEWNTTPLRAHNEVLQVLATQGLVGLGALLVLAAGLVVATVRAWFRAAREQRLLVVALAAGILGFAVQNCFSFTVVGQGTLFVTFAALLSTLAFPRRLVGALPPPGCPGVWTHLQGHRSASLAGFAAALIAAFVAFSLLFLRNVDLGFARTVAAAPLGIAIVLTTFGSLAFTIWIQESRMEERLPAVDLEAVPRRGWRVRGAQAAVWLCAILVANILILQPLQASLACRQGDLMLAKDLHAALALYEQAIAASPENALYWEKLGVAVREGIDKTQNQAERRQVVECGRRAFARAAELMPGNGYYHLGLGRMLMELCRLGLASPADVAAELDRALALDENNATYYADAANAALAMEQLDLARSYASRGCERYPDFGLLRAHLGYVALMEKHYDEAAELLTEALREKWYYSFEDGDHASGPHLFAQDMLQKVIVLQRASHGAARR